MKRYQSIGRSKGYAFPPMQVPKGARRFEFT